MAILKRKLYRRGSSFETTIPMPLLFSVDISKRHNVLFSLDPLTNRWYVSFELAGEKEAQKEVRSVRKKRG
jgi:hypothetical protein